MDDKELLRIIREIRTLLFSIENTEVTQRQHIQFREIRLLSQRAERGTK